VNSTPDYNPYYDEWISKGGNYDKNALQLDGRTIIDT
jgi:hypothetical protein